MNRIERAKGVGSDAAGAANGAARRTRILRPATPPARAPATSPDPRDPALYINRELSLLEFQARVLELARDPATPLLERVRFLTICSTNLDEFFEIRVSGLKQQVALQVSQAGPDGLGPQETLSRVSEAAHRLVAEQYRVLNQELLPALEKEGIRILEREQWTRSTARWVKRFFAREVLPVLTPVGLDPAHPFPRLLNKSLNFIVSLEGTDAFGRSSGIAVVQAPRSLPRLIELPRGKEPGGTQDFVLLSTVVHAQVGDLFPGMQVRTCHPFRVTRNSDLWVDEEETDDLLHALKGELSSRNFGDAVRLEVAEDCSGEIAESLLAEFRLEPADLYRVDGPVNLHRIAALRELVDRTDLKYPSLIPGIPRRLARARDPFQVIRRGDLLLHHPFESFAPVVELVRLAAEDPDVLAIKQTLYRTGDDSPLVEALFAAARNGKEVTAVIELRARFDEAANIKLATRLQEAGAKVVYGVVGYKTHLKALLIVRREGRRLRHYVHLATGNYHPGTARGYTDFGLLTCDRDLGEDVHKLFMQLTGLGRVPRLRKIRQSPFGLHRALLSLIQDEIENAKRGRKARIVAKLNSLSEPRIIQALYQASQAGVEVDLVVRGICCLRPGLPGVSENIRVRSILGRFLEHTRVYHFHAGGRDLVFCSSADWMARSFFTRVETCFPVEDPRARARVLEEGLELYLQDNSQAWALLPDGHYRRIKPGSGKARCAQEELLARHVS